ncbi:MAG: hypothetical protein LBM75_06820 [Myxococcales bacterium]|nr:hypothetical protein [Myxococcales bacterium]
MSPKRSLRWLSLACALGFFLSAGADECLAAARTKARHRIAKVIPTYAYLVPDSSQFIDADPAFLKNALAKAKRRRGVKRGEIIDDKEIRLEIDPKTFQTETVIQDLEGLRVAMRPPYKGIELRVVDGASFPPRSEINDDGMLVVELSTQLKEAINEAVHFNLPPRMKCVGKLDSPKANDATLLRFEKEKLSPAKMIPFMSVADFDGDKRPDLFLRLRGLPEMIVFNQGNGFNVVPLRAPPTELSTIPRCSQDPLQYVRAVPNKQVRCLSAEKRPKKHKGDGFELINLNVSNQLLMWDGSKIVSCEPLGEAVIP